MYRNTTYHFVKIVNGKEKLIIETESSCLERALDYFYLMVPEAYGDNRYTIKIKKGDYIEIKQGSIKEIAVVLHANNVEGEIVTTLPLWNTYFGAEDNSPERLDLTYRF